MSQTPELSQSQGDYLKALYHLGAGEPVAGSLIADRLGVSPASATEMLGKLAAQGLVTHERYRGAELTAGGRRAALALIRRHRLIETFLVRILAYSWDEVHEEAERLEHVVSRRFEERMFEALGRPDVDCHGDPIPSPEGQITDIRHPSLLEAHQGERHVVRRVSDADPGRLRLIDELGLRPGVEVVVLRESAYEGPMLIRTEERGGEREVEVPLGAARGVFVA
ncbi:MAG: metal-dependent transcriptional regulator [Candidatus Dormibacteraceae bacterium]